MKITPFALERYLARYEFAVRHVLCASDCESMSVNELLSFEPGARESLLALRLGYTESPGNPSLRREISGIYRTIRPDDTLVLSGAEEAIFAFMHAALAAADHVIVHWPCYQSLFEIASSIGCTVSRWIAREQEGWALDPEELRALVRPETKAIIINTPHNPTGYLMSRDVLQEVARIADAAGIILFCDEVYRESEHREEDRLPAACDLSDRAVSLGVMSKTYGLPGLRVGWAATRHSRLLADMARMKDYTTICASAPGEFLAELALRHRQALAARSRRIIGENLPVLDAFFARYPTRFQWRPPKAGPVAFPRLLGGGAEGFCDSLVREVGVLLLPGTVFGNDNEHFRVGFGRANLGQAVSRLEEFLHALAQ